MLSFAVPWVFGVAVAAAAVVFGLHLLSARTPPVLMLPTARFVPGGDARAVARQPRLNDLLLLMLRVLALLCAGAAIAGVQWSTTRASRLRLVVADEGMTDTVAWRDSVQRALADDDVLVAAHLVGGVSRDPGAALVSATAQSAALLAAHRSLSTVELTVVLDSSAATLAGFAAWRSQWPGAVRVATPGGSRATAPVANALPVRVTGASDRDDAVAAALSLGSGVGGGNRLAVPVVMVQRGSAASNAATTREATSPAALQVAWPSDGMPVSWTRRSRPDTVGAVVANGSALVGPWVRTAILRDSVRTLLDTSRTMRAVAWWSDGEVAAIERRVDNSCTREAAVVVPRGSDLLTSSSARGLLTALTGPCGGVRMSTAMLRDNRTAVSALAPASAFRDDALRTPGSDPWWMTPVLLTVALLCLVGEWWWRRHQAVA
ncbi:BatA domain-containing protein [Gemmatimonas sp.]|jgi:hypothetical protein|uniref:BatA domain-containing protein n=1 Tax=Gemmatimonas sp. TaxID=1962908 RepID=UPI0037BE55B8